MNVNIDWDKLLRYLNGTATLEEELEISLWIDSNPENEKLVQFVEKIWRMNPAEINKSDVDSAWKRFNNQYDLDNSSEKKLRSSEGDNHKSRTFLRNNNSSTSMYWLLASGMAAILIIAALVSYNVTDLRDTPEKSAVHNQVEYREIRTDRGQRTRITLSDGSVIHLNADSYLRMPAAFIGDATRKINLEGEAFFDIKRAGNATFQVFTSGSVTTVMGTRFNVRSYPEDEEVTVVVAEGLVSLGHQNKPGTEPVLLTEFQRGVIGYGDMPIVTEVRNLSEYHGWIRGELVFMNEPLPQMITRLERWFGISLEQENLDKPLLDKRLTTSYAEGQPVEDVLQSISHVLGLSIEKKDSSGNIYQVYVKQ
jgi:transmembrane sensor